MSDDTTTSVTGGQEAIYTTAVTSTIGRPPRKVYFWIQVIAVAVTLGLCWLSRSYKERMGQADLKDLTQVTTLLMRVGELLTTPIGMACALSIVLGLGLLAVKGVLDSVLKLLIWLNVLWLIVFVGFHTMSIWMPFFRSQQALGK